MTIYRVEMIEKVSTSVLWLFVLKNTYMLRHFIQIHEWCPMVFENCRLRLTTVLSFCAFVLLFRLKTLTTESSFIVAALQKSKTGLLEISEDKTKIRRSPDKPLPEINDDYKDALKHKSVYIVGILI